MSSELLPEHALCEAPKDRVSIMQQLCTKDGRRMGNGCVKDIFIKWYKTDPAPVTIIQVITDAGNEINMTLGEISECFSLGEYILKVTPPEQAACKLLGISIEEYLSGNIKTTENIPENIRQIILQRQ